MPGCLRAFAGALLLLLGMGAASLAAAHPMPNTEIAISLGDDGARFDVAVPVPELRLALPQAWPRTADLFAEPQRAVVLRYFSEHLAVRSREGLAQPLEIQSLQRWSASDPDVGDYEELRLRFFARASSRFDARAFTLHYDAVIHQVPNHFALVSVVQDFRAGQLAGDSATEVGVIRYDFSRDLTPSLSIAVAAGSLWRGLRATIALGFHHVIGGFDHLLFLVTLLVVAPLRAVENRWSLFQGWRYTTRRFLAISLAFTAGHSLALLLGTYELVPVPRKAIEVVIAGSILLAAIHAIRPLFSGREWLIAGGFGIVHGLAFAESLAGLTLAPATRALAVLGFNIGVEGAQLVAMACAVPLLLASRWPWFHALRVVAMLGAAALAAWWMLQRAL